jgi:hypothetical protein
VCITG